MRRTDAGRNPRFVAPAGCCAAGDPVAAGLLAGNRYPVPRARAGDGRVGTAHAAVLASRPGDRADRWWAGRADRCGHRLRLAVDLRPVVLVPLAAGLMSTRW